MSDIQSALAKALNEWEPNAVKPPTTPTSEQAGGVAKGTFEYIRDNPHLTKRSVVQALALAGYNPSSTASLISTMVKQGLVKKTPNGTLHTLVDVFSQLKSAYKPVQKSKTQQNWQGIAALDIEALIGTITIREAITLYAKLAEALGR